MTKDVSATDLDDAIESLEQAVTAGIQTLVSNLAGSGNGLREAGRQAAGLASKYPWMVAVAGAGLAGAALFISRKRPQKPSTESLMSWENEGGAVEETGTSDSAPEAWLQKANAARDAAAKKLQALIDNGQLTARKQTEIAVEFGNEVAAALRHDLSHLSETAAKQVIEARERAMDLFEVGKVQAKEGWDQARQNPMTSAAATIAAAALVAAILPSTRRMLKPVAAQSAKTAAVALATEGVSWLENKSSQAKNLDAVNERLRAKSHDFLEAIATSARLKRDQVASELAKIERKARASSPR